MNFRKLFQGTNPASPDLASQVPEFVPYIKYKIVEVDSPRTPLEGGETEEMQASIATLAYHPGFQYLLKRLALQNAALKSKLTYERHKTLDEVNFFQAGVYWSGWLLTELKRTTVKVVSRKIDPVDEELAAFKAIDSQLERVGMDE